MDYYLFGVVVLTSLSALPTLLIINNLSFLKDSYIVALLTLCFIASAAVPAYVLRRRYRNVDYLICVFSMFCWAGVMSILMSLEIDGVLKAGMVAESLYKMEPYMNCSYGTMMIHWDASAHLLLEFSAIFLHCRQESYREVGLYWAGSVINTFMVVLLGAVIGQKGATVHTFSDVVFSIIPLIAFYKLLKERPLQARSYLRKAPLTRRPVDLLFAVYFVLALGLAVFRGLIVLGAEMPLLKDYLITYEPYLADPSGFSKAQMLVYMFYFSVYYVCVIDSLLFPGNLWMADWSIIHAGASAQSQFTYIAGAFHRRTPRNFLAPKGGVAGGVFLAVNLALLVVPHLFAWRCWRDSDNCGRTYTVDMPRPISLAPSHHSHRTPSKRD